MRADRFSVTIWMSCPPGWALELERLSAAVYKNPLTRTRPVPNEPDQEPPLKEIHFRSPNGVLPTDIRGLSFTDMRKSCVRSGGGRSSVGWGRVSSLGACGVLVKQKISASKILSRTGGRYTVWY